MKKKSLPTRIFILAICIISLDFLPVKLAKRNTEAENVFVNSPKLGNNVEWFSCAYKNDGNIIGEYVIMGNSPNNVLAKKDFDKTALYLMQGDKLNKFIMTYEKINTVSDEGTIPIYEISVSDWEIVYPIHRASFRKYYAPKDRLTVYDYNWLNVIKQLFKKCVK